MGAGDKISPCLIRNSGHNGMHGPRKRQIYGHNNADFGPDDVGIGLGATGSMCILKNLKERREVIRCVECGDCAESGKGADGVTGNNPASRPVAAQAQTCHLGSCRNLEWLSSDNLEYSVGKNRCP